MAFHAYSAARNTGAWENLDSAVQVVEDRYFSQLISLDCK
jgi:hypothetical protein